MTTSPKPLFSPSRAWLHVLKAVLAPARASGKTNAPIRNRRSAHLDPASPKPPGRETNRRNQPGRIWARTEYRLLAILHDSPGTRLILAGNCLDRSWGGQRWYVEERTVRTAISLALRHSPWASQIRNNLGGRQYGGTVLQVFDQRADPDWAT